MTTLMVFLVDSGGTFVWELISRRSPGLGPSCGGQFLLLPPAAAHLYTRRSRK